MSDTTAKYIRLSSEDDDLRKGGKVESKRYWAVLRTGVAIIARLAALFRCLYTV